MEEMSQPSRGRLRIARAAYINQKDSQENQEGHKKPDVDLTALQTHNANVTI